MCPSWCLTLRARGHSYGAFLEHHIPQYSLDAPKVSVAPVAVGGGTGELGDCLALKIPLRTPMASDTSQYPPGPSQRPHHQPLGSGHVGLSHGPDCAWTTGPSQLPLI